MKNITISLHIGAPQTDNNQLIRSLRKDTSRLVESGILVRRPGKFHKVIDHLLEKQVQEYVPDEEREALLAGLVRNRPVNRLVLSSPRYMGVPAWMLNGGRLFKNAGRNTGELRELFPNNKCEFFLGIRNPATLIPAVFEAQSKRSLDEFLSNADLLNILWSEVIHDIQTENPGYPITVWCNEDTPLIWPNVLGAVTGLGTSFRFAGEPDILRAVMPEASVKRLEQYLDDRPEFSEAQRGKVQAAFLERFYSEDAVKDEINLPEWSESLVEAMTSIYEADVARIEKNPGVTFIA